MAFKQCKNYNITIINYAIIVDCLIESLQHLQVIIHMVFVIDNNYQSYIITRYITKLCAICIHCIFVYIYIYVRPMYVRCIYIEYYMQIDANGRWFFL